MPVVNATGSSGGAGELLVVNPIVFHTASESVSGVGSVTANESVQYLVSGFAQGRGDLIDPFLKTASGTVVGFGHMQPATAFRILVAYGQLSGGGTFGLLGYPLPMRGSGDLFAYAQAERALILCPCPPRNVPILRWGDGTGRDALTLCLKDMSGNRITPYNIWYTLYQRVGAWEKRIGPEQRVPVMQDIGEFYAPVGFGDEGQPGDWIIEWSWQYNSQSSPESIRYDFRVLDAALANDPNDQTRRCGKYGWFD